MALTLRQLRAFTAVAESGSFTSAAGKLSLTQSALSVLVRELESEVGVRLFDRHTRGVLLTDAGREFQPLVLRLLTDLNDAVSSIADLGSRHRGIVRLAAPQVIASAVLPDVIGAYRRKFPGIEVRLNDSLPEKLLEALASGVADLAFGHELEHDASIEGSVFFEDSFSLVCRADDAMAGRRKVRWSDLAARAFIGPTRDFRQRLLPKLDLRTRKQFAIAPWQDVSYLTTALGLVMAGQGITVGPKYAARLVRAYGLRMIELDTPVFKRRLFVYRLVRRAPTPAAVAFIDTLREFMGAMKG